VKDLSHYDVIMGQGLFIELEDLNERVLYDYGEITRRQAAVNEPIPIDELKLIPHYDVVCTPSRFSIKAMQERGLLSPGYTAKNEKEEKSLTLYRQFERYDVFLESVRRNHPVISYKDLTQGELMERIGRIFALSVDEHGHYRSREFKRWYQERGMFPSDKAGDVQIYRGIWYGSDGSYLVGSPMGMKQNQPKAHLIRRFDVYIGKDHFEIQPLLLATSVRFVRLNQYTVYPYAFHLIDVNVENFLRFKG